MLVRAQIWQTTLEAPLVLPSYVTGICPPRASLAMSMIREKQHLGQIKTYIPSLHVLKR